MDLRSIVAHLAELASFPAERRLAHQLVEIIQDDGIPLAQQEAHLRGELETHGLDILALPWGRGLAPDVAAFLSQLAGGRSIPDLVLHLVVNGCGAAATSPAMESRLWVPGWIYAEAVARSGLEAPPAPPERLVIPSGWPVPIRQVLVGGFTDGRTLEQAYQLLDLRPASPVDELAYPSEWIFADASEPQACLREDLMAYAVMEPTRAMRMFLSGGGNPLLAIAHELAIASIQESAQRKAMKSLWNGLFPSTGTQIISYQKRVMLTPGWFLLAISQLGFHCVGATAAETRDIEEGMIRKHGGALAEGNGERYCILPVSASDMIFSVEIDWSGIHTV